MDLLGGQLPHRVSQLAERARGPVVAADPLVLQCVAGAGCRVTFAVCLHPLIAVAGAFAAPPNDQFYLLDRERRLTDEREPLESADFTAADVLAAFDSPADSERRPVIGSVVRAITSPPTSAWNP